MTGGCWERCWEKCLLGHLQQDALDYVSVCLAATYLKYLLENLRYTLCNTENEIFFRGVQNSYGYKRRSQLIWCANWDCLSLAFVHIDVSPSLWTSVFYNNWIIHMMLWLLDKQRWNKKGFRVSEASHKIGAVIQWPLLSDWNPGILDKPCQLVVQP